MRLGIDFGTSNSAAAAVIDGAVVPVQFGEQAQFRTSVYFPEVMREVDDFVPNDAQEHQLQQLVDAARRQAQAAGQERPAQALRREALRAVRRDWMEEQMRQPRTSAALLQNAVYGEDALDAYFAEGEGNLVQSPKSMLGYNLHPRARQTITGIATHILEHIRLTAQRQFDTPVREAVLGRPVQFRSSMGEAGNDQALEILQAAATAAGFDRVRFLEEPSAAAMRHHAASDTRHEVVVVDIGGGTTDVAHADVGGALPPAVRRAWGIARGGTDVDLALSLAGYMPLFGRGITRVPNHHYAEAATVHDLTRQREFRLHKYDSVDAPYGPRLQALQDTGNTARLARGVERSKIVLSGAAQHTDTLDYIEPALSVTLQAAGLTQAAESFLGQMRELLAQVAADIGHDPDAVFLTGGMSRAPYVQQVVREAFPRARLVHGDPSFGVVQGLALAASGGLG
ncbi:Hsp70 family protein [Pseudoxanthomonas composti]|uniref:Heat-shock protein Hsp70 n=1 Tax=Pseudoxanthomonas composti TaxID=2137479 RepID=A0A4Q1JV39_9GAMM|nr:Hsp70 family protein [Pseudoxanthomonas composti]RXR06009.1 heat-shock protein Hsp70 [Pseudoxanthomonas composti]